MIPRIAKHLLMFLVLFSLASCATHEDPAAAKAERAVVGLKSEVKAYLAKLEPLAKAEALPATTLYSDSRRLDSFDYYRKAVKAALNSLEVALAWLKLERGQTMLVKSTPTQTRRQTIGFSGRGSRDLSGYLRVLKERQSFVSGRGTLAEHHQKTLAFLEKAILVLDEVKRLVSDPQ